MLCLIIYINKLIAVLPWEIAMILEKLLNAHLCTCCFLKDALGETPRVRQIWTLSALKNKLSHSMWDRHPDNPSVCGLCKHCLCLHELQKPHYYLFFFSEYENMLRCLSFKFCVLAVTAKVFGHTYILHMRITHYTYYYTYVQWFTPTRSEHKTGYILFSYACFKIFFSLMSLT